MTWLYLAATIAAGLPVCALVLSIVRMLREREARADHDRGLEARREAREATRAPRSLSIRARSSHAFTRVVTGRLSGKRYAEIVKRSRSASIGTGGEERLTLDLLGDVVRKAREWTT
jgi:hypothetical protein